MTNKRNAKRPALSIKIDNISAARPQAGLNDADIVTEALVEGGLTRLLATFQSHDAPLVGPIRSARPVDADLLRELGGGIFAYSGAAPGEIKPSINHSDALLVSNDDMPQWFYRASNRIAPDNLMSSTARLYKAGRTLRPKAATAPQLFTYSDRPVGKTRHVRRVSMIFSAASSAGWTYSHKRYDRTEDGTPHTLVGGATVTATNVVILSTKFHPTHIIDDAGNADPYDLVTGSGKCWVLRNGVLITGRWTRPTYKTKVHLTTSDGTRIALAPGRTWIELLPPPNIPKFS